MKKILSLLLALLCLFSSFAFAEPQTIDLETMSLDQLQKLYSDVASAISNLTSSNSSTPALGAFTPVQTPEATSSPSSYVTLNVGYRGPEVEALKQRMYELGYFKTNTVNDQYTENTAGYVREFEAANGLKVDGIADPEMQELFFSSAAKPKPTPTPDPRKAYATNFNYKDVSRYPETYKGQKYKITGYIVQVLGSRKDGYQIRLATKGKYDNIIYVFVDDDPGFGLLEDDRVTVYGAVTDPITYTSVRNVEITIPGFNADMIELN